MAGWLAAGKKGDLATRMHKLAGRGHRPFRIKLALETFAGRTHNKKVAAKMGQDFGWQDVLPPPYSATCS